MKLYLEFRDLNPGRFCGQVGATRKALLTHAFGRAKYFDRTGGASDVAGRLKPARARYLVQSIALHGHV